MTHYCAIACCVSSSLALDQIPQSGPRGGSVPTSKATGNARFRVKPRRRGQRAMSPLARYRHWDWPGRRPSPRTRPQAAMWESIRPGITVHPTKSMTWVLGPGCEFRFRHLRDVTPQSLDSEVPGAAVSRCSITRVCRGQTTRSPRQRGRAESPAGRGRAPSRC
jgi:hypothetical protein